jgi:hypothetical protein
MRPIALPEIVRLREVRRAVAVGGITPVALRTPEDNARITTFRALAELLQLLDQYRRRVERGEKVRLVEREHVHEEGRMLVEFTIEVLT